MRQIQSIFTELPRRTLLEEAVTATVMVGAAKRTTTAVAAAVRVVVVFVLELFEDLLADLRHDSTTSHGAKGTHVAAGHLVSGPTSGSTCSHSADATFAGNRVSVLVVLHRLLLLVVAVRLLLLLAVRSGRRGPVAGRRLCAITSGGPAAVMLWLRAGSGTGVRRLRSSRI